MIDNMDEMCALKFVHTSEAGNAIEGLFETWEKAIEVAKRFREAPYKEWFIFVDDKGYEVAIYKTDSIWSTAVINVGIHWKHRVWLEHETEKMRKGKSMTQAPGFQVPSNMRKN